MAPLQQTVREYRIWFLMAILLASCVTLVLGCTKTAEQEKIRIAFNPWPGYEFLYLAEKKGFFKAQGLNIEMVAAASLSDVLRAFMSGRVNAMASTMSEIVKSIVDHNAKVTPVLVADYSLGSDVIIAHKSVSSLKDLKGQPIGLERDSLGAYMLYRALQKEEMKFSEVVQVQAEQSEGQRLLEQGIIKAFVSYPPASLKILDNPEYTVIFDSSKIPKEVIDLVVVKSEVLTNAVEFKQKFHQAWQQAVDFYQANPQEAAVLMASREGISIEDFIATINDLVIVQASEQAELLTPGVLMDNATTTCHLIYGEALKQCSELEGWISFDLNPAVSASEQ